MVNKKAGPTETLGLELLKDKAVGDYLRLTLGVPGGKSTEVILHHPIGVTDLDRDDWVLSSPEEVSQMKSRSKDPNATSLSDKRTAYIRAEAISSGELVESNGSVHYAGLLGQLPRGKFLDDLKKKALKKHEKEKDYKYILKLALDEETEFTDLVKAEKDYRQWVVSVQKEADERFPQSFRTAKGPLEDVKQTAISWLKGKKITEIGPLVMKHGVTGPVTADTTVEADDYTIGDDGSQNQWFFFKLSDSTEKKNLRALLTKFRKENSMDFKVLIEDP
jgi:hypothetical protein